MITEDEIRQHLNDLGATPNDDTRAGCVVITEDEIRQHLNDLGATPNEVAKTLVEGGFKGRKRECSDCPVANYLKAKTGSSAVSVYFGAYVEEEETKTPVPVFAFIKAFDGGQYPELVQPEEVF